MISLITESFSQDYNLNQNHLGLIENLNKLQFDWSLPPNINNKFEMGINLLDNRDWENALNAFNEVIEYDSTFSPAYYFRSKCFDMGKKTKVQQITGQMNFFLSRYSNSNTNLFTDIWDLYLPSHQLVRNNIPLFEIEPPLFKLSQYLIMNKHKVKESTFYLLKSSLASLIAARPKLALTQVKKSQEIELSVSSLYLEAVIYQFLSKYDDSFLLYSKVLEQDSSVIEGHENMALYKLRLGDKIGVLKHLNILKKIEPDSRSISRFSGLMKIQLQDYYGAIIDLTQYLNVTGKDFNCLKNRAIALYEVGSYDESLKDLDLALTIYDQDLDVYLYKSNNYFELGDKESCVKTLFAAQEIFSFDQRLDLFTASRLVEVNELKKAQEIVTRVIAVINRNNFSKDYLNKANLIQCQIYLKKGNVEKALKSVTKLIEKDRDYLDFQFFRAQIYLANGENEKAKNDLERLIDAKYEPAYGLLQSIKP